MGNLNLDDAKQTFSDFCSKHIFESLTLVAIVLGAISSWLGFFVGTIGGAVLFLVVGSSLGLLLPSKMDKFMTRVHSFLCASYQPKMWVSQGAMMAVALFTPFLYFAFLGVMAGTAYNSYIHGKCGEKNKEDRAA